MSRTSTPRNGRSRKMAHTELALIVIPIVILAIFTVLHPFLMVFWLFVAVPIAILIGTSAKKANHLDDPTDRTLEAAPPIDAPRDAA